MDDSSLPDATLAAYRAAVYRIYGEAPIDMMIGEKNADIAALLPRHGVSRAVFVTAFNPFGRELDAQENAARQHMLEARIVQSGLTALPGEGMDPKGIWTAEASLLVLGATEQDADELMLAYQQNAVVIVHSDGSAQLRVHPQHR